MNNTFLLFYSLKPLEPSMNFFLYMEIGLL